MNRKDMERYFKEVIKVDRVASDEVIELMIKAQSFNRILVKAIEGSSVGNYTVNTFHSFVRRYLSVYTTIEVMEDNGFRLDVVDGHIRLIHDDMVRDGMDHKEVVFYLFDKLREYVGDR